MPAAKTSLCSLSFASWNICRASCASVGIWGQQLTEAIGEAVCCLQEVQKWDELETFDMWRACKSNASCKAAVLVPHKLAFALRWNSSELLKKTLTYVPAVMVDSVGVISANFPDQTKPDSS